MNKPQERLSKELEGYNTKEKRKTNDEVFTPPHLIQDMLDKLSPEVWENPKLIWLDPCAGLGNFSVIILERLMEGLKEWEPNPKKREKHILEKMLFHVEMNPESVEKLKRVLDPENKFKLNIKCQNFLDLNSQKSKELF